MNNNTLKVWQRFIRGKLAYKKEEEEIRTYTEIIEGIEFKGLNVWILILAMFIASIGLSIDSHMAIIGAMLISPLMGPIIGFAFAISIFNKSLSRICMINWVWMTGVSLVASTIYFLITPFDENTEVLSAFKGATIFDILIAFFGGLAGFIGLIKREGVKIIAGVAVATACMPPLCTAAFGIAHLDYAYFAGGMYNYLINCLFIGLATFLLSRYFKFYQLNPSHHKLSSTARFLWIAFVILMTIPGSYIAYDKWMQTHQKKEAVLTDDQRRIILLEKRIAKLEASLQQLEAVEKEGEE